MDRRGKIEEKKTTKCQRYSFTTLVLSIILIIESCLQALKDVPRQAYILTTKVGKYSPDVLKMYDYSFSRTEDSVNNSLNKLQVDCIDIVQVTYSLGSSEDIHCQQETAQWLHRQFILKCSCRLPPNSVGWSVGWLVGLIGGRQLRLHCPLDTLDLLLHRLLLCCSFSFSLFVFDYADKLVVDWHL